MATAALFALPYIFQSIKIASFTTALWVALILAVVNTLVRPVLFLLTLPVTILEFTEATLVEIRQAEADHAAAVLKIQRELQADQAKVEFTQAFARLGIVQVVVLGIDIDREAALLMQIRQRVLVGRQHELLADAEFLG